MARLVEEAYIKAKRPKCSRCGNDMELIAWLRSEKPRDNQIKLCFKCPCNFETTEKYIIVRMDLR